MRKKTYSFVGYSINLSLLSRGLFFSYDKRVKKLFAFLLILLFLYFFQSQTSFAQETCEGVVYDSSDNQPIEQVAVSIIWGNTNKMQRTQTNSLGEYSFPIISGGAFGTGAMQIYYLEFSKSGYQTKLIETSGLNGHNAACPGNVELETTPQTTNQGFVCNSDKGCIPVTSGSKYTIQSSCEQDCQKLKYDDRLKRCNVPDAQYHSQAEECAKVPASTPGPTPTIKISSDCRIISNLTIKDCQAGNPIQKIDCKTPDNVSGFMCLQPGKQIFCKNKQDNRVMCEIPPVFPPPCDEFKDNKCLKVKTGLGVDIDPTPVGFVKSIFGIILSLSGGIALILIIVSGYQMMASQGNPEKLQGAKETLTSAVVGLLFIIFSMVILQVIGVDILKIPGFR